MYTNKFFDFTISGENFDPIILNKDINMDNCEIYIKGDITSSLYSKRDFVQKTNRWVYSAMLQDHTKIETFLTKNLNILVKKLDILKPYMENYKAIMELTIYGDSDINKNNRLHFKLSKSHMQLLNKIGVELQVAYFAD